MQASLEIEEAPQARGGIGTWHSQGPDRDEWLTPPHVLAALGPFDLDPCAPVRRPWAIAANHYTVHDNGLTKPWVGRVWMNPPYGNNTTRWMQRLAEHGNGVALIFARTETATFFPWVWEHATALLFLKGRLAFHFSDGSPSRTSAGAPSVLIAYGSENATALASCGLAGKLMHNDQVQRAAEGGPPGTASSAAGAVAKGV